MLRIINLGRMGYQRALDIQLHCATEHRRLMAKDGQSCLGDTLLLVEHDPVYTVGVRSGGYSEETAKKLRAFGADYYKTNRGGLITFHGPGQLVAYPILNLTHYASSLRWYIHALERVLVETCLCVGVKAGVTDDVGVWVDNRKIAAIGVHAKRHITTHGVALNCNVDLSWYSHIIACGLEGKGVTSLSKELAREIVEGTVLSVDSSLFYLFSSLLYRIIDDHKCVTWVDNQICCT